MRSEKFVGWSLTHEHRKWDEDEEINVQELVVREVGTYRVKESHIYELDH